MATKPTRRKGLRKDDRRLIRSLSRSNAEKTLAGLKPFIARSRWLGSTNHYCKDTLAKIKSDASARRIRCPLHLAQYISASCLLHCSDGWSYLGKALLSILRGDPHRAVHLAYYAELRAAVSLLATEGIGIFNNRHFVIDASRSVVRMHGGNSPTHQFTWNCLDYWASLPSSGTLFASVIKPYGRTLDDWLYPLGGGNAIAPKAREWFRQWGMDLKKLPEDRDARNESSYQPDGIPDAWRVDAAKVLRFACDLWWALEPSAESRFDLIDRHILRIALNGIFNGRTGRSAEENAEEFRTFIMPVIDHQGFATAARQQWLDFMIRTRIPDDPLIFKFSREFFWNAGKQGSSGNIASGIAVTICLRFCQSNNSNCGRCQRVHRFLVGDIGAGERTLGRG